jgi:excisionase family DNA binding protein
MDSGWLSVEQVAERLGLHVRTVRGYIRSGRLGAVRIGKQYRIARADLDAFTGRAAPATRAAAEVSAVVDLPGVGPAAADRLATLLVAGAQGRAEARGDAAGPLRIRTVHDDARAHLKIIIFGGVAATADILHTIHAVCEADDDLPGGLRGPQGEASRAGLAGGGPWLMW